MTQKVLKGFVFHAFPAIQICCSLAIHIHFQRSSFDPLTSSPKSNDRDEIRWTCSRYMALALEATQAKEHRNVKGKKTKREGKK
jgi:hypothetical protein